ncbi:hypothetical protein POM88_044845 [Heracleum sosnowskyi]|uniref:Uncharacterized protein n=1 Tax=Heracleum sosnowskyi TaxID=360622 RepID=A0AAD8H607_9APIA|nr:hypothetical protein POM88_044845 [Heracleum sosnowskyi]
MGLANVGVHYETYNTWILGPVTLKGLNEGTRDLTKQKWPLSYLLLLHPLAISKAGLQASEVDYYEINEAFSVVAPANKKLFGISDDSSWQQCAIFNSSHHHITLMVLQRYP